jgi:hypothetical protein
MARSVAVLVLATAELRSAPSFNRPRSLHRPVAVTDGSPNHSRRAPWSGRMLSTAGASRRVNTGTVSYEEVVIFFLSRPGMNPAEPA